MTPTDDELRQLARSVARRAHAPHSGFRVGCAVRCGAHVHVGANVESASYGLTLCAERSALAAAVAAGERHADVVVIACIDAEGSSSLESFLPCGACRQWLAELAPEARVLLADRPEEFTVAELLPNAFRLS